MNRVRWGLPLRLVPWGLLGLLAFRGVTACADDATPGPGPDTGLGPDTTVGDGLADLPEGPGRWVTLSLPPLGERQEHAVVALGGEVVMLAGFRGDGAETASVEALDPGADVWRRLADLPVAMHHPNAAVVDGRLLVVGYLAGGFTAHGRIFEYDAAADAWSEREPMPAGTERGSAGVAVLDGRVYLAGGLRGGRALTDVSSYDPGDGTWRTHAPLPERRDHMAAAALGGRLYVAGGRDVSLRAHTASLVVYDPERDEWSALAPMPTSRAGVAAAVMHERLFVIGGEGNPDHASGVFEAVEAYAPERDAWEVLAPLPTRRHGTGAATVGGMIVVPQGGDRQAFGWVQAVEAWVP
jgi:N-acetylneuraminic acid mutarotase